MYMFSSSKISFFFTTRPIFCYVVLDVLFNIVDFSNTFLCFTPPYDLHIVIDVV